jgi:hypothetical protein
LVGLALGNAIVLVGLAAGGEKIAPAVGEGIKGWMVWAHACRAKDTAPAAVNLRKFRLFTSCSFFLERLFTHYTHFQEHHPVVTNINTNLEFRQLE